MDEWMDGDTNRWSITDRLLGLPQQVTVSEPQFHLQNENSDRFVLITEETITRAGIRRCLPHAWPMQAFSVNCRTVSPRLRVDLGNSRQEHRGRNSTTVCCACTETSPVDLYSHTFTSNCTHEHIHAREREREQLYIVFSVCHWHACVQLLQEHKVTPLRKHPLLVSKKTPRLIWSKPST